jgi:hypothetical protein
MREVNSLTMLLPDVEYLAGLQYSVPMLRASIDSTVGEAKVIRRE